MNLSIMIEGQMGLTWPRWQHLAENVEKLGFAGLFRSDHFTNAHPPDSDSLETYVSLAYLASHTQRLHFGPLVSPLSFRDPIFLARQAMAIDDLSGGRMILGIGAGWQEREHHMFGYALLNPANRMRRLEEGLQIITEFIRSEQPVNLTGKYYTLKDAQLLPRPARRTPVLVGGNGPKRTLGLAARFADIWNAVGLDLETFKARSALLDELLSSNGRHPEDVRRTLMLPVLVWRSETEQEKRMLWLRSCVPAFAESSDQEILSRLRSNMAGILGSPDFVRQGLQAYAQAGVDEVMMQWLALEDEEGIKILADELI